jgi:ribosome-binding protein aMBF1 (putative translation factor)
MLVSVSKEYYAREPRSFDIGFSIWFYRQQINMSRDLLSMYTEGKLSTDILNIETGHINPTTDDISKLARVLQVSVEHIMNSSFFVEL